MEVSDVRRRLQQELERGRVAHAERRARNDAAARSYADFLSRTATPVFRMLITALKAEGFGCSLFTPAASLRLASDRSGDDYIELVLDSEGDLPRPKLHISRTRGRQTLESERMIGEPGRAIGELTDEDVLEALLAEISALVVR
ncbi:MAG: hypothetical protein HYS05_16015 [Acidobacteria bacterium]|nr:hypothetical protein [Acidobacteriota bacterium]